MVTEKMQKNVNFSNKSEKEIKVLIVEDYKLTRVGLKFALNKASKNINVTHDFECAKDAIEHLQKSSADVILMDLGLPNMNGFEATMKIKEMAPDVKIIILTSHQMPEEVNAALGAGANAYCLKDIDPITLSGVIVNVAKGACYIDPAVTKSALKMFPKPTDVEFLSKTSQSEVQVRLTEREQEVLELLVQGKSNTEIAKELIVSVHTAKAHVCSILQKLCVDDRVQAAVRAIREGLVKGEAKRSAT